MVTSHKFNVGESVQLNTGEGPVMNVTSSTVNFFNKSEINVMCEYFDEKAKHIKTLKFNQLDLMRA